MVQVSAWDFVVFCAGLLITGIGGLVASLRWFLGAVETRQTQGIARIHDRLDAMEEARQKDSQQWRNVERELLELKAELPSAYVRKDDYVRGQVLLETKMDALAVKIENLLLKRGGEND